MNFRDPKDAKQYTLDLIATMTMLMHGFISHPQYNSLVREIDPKEFIENVKDEFRQINTYIVGRCIAEQILNPTLRYTATDVQLMIIEMGSNYAGYVFLEQKRPSYAVAIRVFDALMMKYFNK